MSESYEDVVEDIFFGKLKTALVIDDEYPTIDRLLYDNATIPGENTDVGKRIRSLVKSLRAVKPPLIIDIHDGQTSADQDIVRSVLPIRFFGT